MSHKPAAQRRRERQGGQQIIEFAMLSFLWVPLLLGAMVTGQNLVRSIQAQQVCRDLDSIYIHGGDLSTYPMQQLAQRLSTGLNLQIGASFTGNDRANTDNSGDAIVMVSQIMYIGPTTATRCARVGAGNCTNHDSFVFTQRVRFGNGSMSGVTDSLGNPTTTAITSAGWILNPETDAGARVPDPGQTNMRNLWQVSTNGRTPLADGQVVYIVELYAQSPGITLGSFSAGGIYARYFF